MESETFRLTLSQALVRYLIAQRTLIEGEDGEQKEAPLFAGVWAIFGHGNVAGLGEALEKVQRQLPTFRGHNEQGMAHAAIAFAKEKRRRQIMAVTTSIGPGAVNLATAAALAHVNRLPVLFLPGDVFASRLPDPVLQQVEDFGDGTVTANDCLRPVSRYFDRLTRPEQLLRSLPAAMAVLTDPARCGPVTLGLCQDAQTEAWDFPRSFFAPRIHRLRRLGPDENELERASTAIKDAKKPLIIAGGGIRYSGAEHALTRFAAAHKIPVALTQAGKGALASDDPMNVGAIGVTGTASANALARESDLLLCVGTRLQDFTTGSWALFENPERQFVGLNVQPLDAIKGHAHSLIGDARRGLLALGEALGSHQSPSSWRQQKETVQASWRAAVLAITRAPQPDAPEKPTDAQVLGAVNRQAHEDDVVVCAAGGLPGELHKLWQVKKTGGYHLEYGFSCMGYEIAGGLGVRMARDKGEVYVLVGDGSYLMLNSEIASSVAMDEKITLVILDNRGFGCINRLQQGTGGRRFKNLLDENAPAIDFAAHAAALGAKSRKVGSVAELEEALSWARTEKSTCAIVIDTDPEASTGQGGAWWDVAVPEVSERPEVLEAREAYVKARQKQG
jgi:3D-(3,5/4)-trihydroxycyclohexane-1,2-dione acylhydrolase (decyclizing)